MAITATDSGVSRELIPAGNYIARCYQMIEIGTITENVLGKNVTAKKVRIGWELPEELRVFDQTKGEQPMVISKEYTLSMNAKANLRKVLESWRGKGFTEAEAKSFDITKLIGAPCMMNIIHKHGVADPTKIYEAISAVSPLTKSTKAPPAINKPLILSYDTWSKEVFDGLPDFIRNRMISSSEFQKMLRPEETNIQSPSDLTEPLDDLPF